MIQFLPQLRSYSCGVSVKKDQYHLHKLVHIENET